MSVKPGNVAAHIPPSLPSFASTFSSKSLSSFAPDDNSLPPIQSRSTATDFRRVEPSSLPVLSRHRSEEDSAQPAGRKRTRADASGSRNEDDHSGSERGSPGLARVKEEPEQDMLDPSPPPPSTETENKTYDTSAAPPPSSIGRSSHKRRRVTISGAPALNTDVRVPPDQTNSTPISPVVIGFTVQPSALEQVRSMITVKQKQQALIEQRRGSAAGITPPAVASGSSTTDAPSKTPAASTRSVRRSPNSGTGNRRHTVVAATHPGGVNGPPSPISAVVSSQPPSQAPATSVPPNSLPPPPISFARRRANQLGGAGKKKPADIVISPREAHTQDQLAPSIQSAPPIPHAGQQSNSFAGRFPMTLPRLPSVMGSGENMRRTMGGNVPPTPTQTRFAAQRSSDTQRVAHTIPAIAGRSPPNASVAISSALVPPTPSSLHHPGYTGEKSAFLAPFEMFYDALNDSKQLKTWLGEQMQRSNTLLQSLTQQQDKLNEIVDSLVEKKVGGMRSEISSLHRRVEELEDALRVATTSRRPSIEGTGSSTSKGKGKQPLRNGIPSAPAIVEGYTFPPKTTVDRDRLRAESERRTSPGWVQDRDRDLRESQSQEVDSGSPTPFDSRRLSLSASRLDPPRSQGMEGAPSRGFAMPSPPIPLREGPSGSLVPPSSKLSRGGVGGRPGFARQQSSPHISGSAEPSASSPPRREDSGRDSISESAMDDRES